MRLNALLKLLVEEVIDDCEREGIKREIRLSGATYPVIVLGDALSLESAIRKVIDILVDAMKMILQSKADTTVVGTGNSCEECIQIVTELHPQVLILDVALPDGNGIDLVPTIKETSPEINVLILTSYRWFKGTCDNRD